MGEKGDSRQPEPLDQLLTMGVYGIRQEGRGFMRRKRPVIYNRQFRAYIEVDGEQRPIIGVRVSSSGPVTFIAAPKNGSITQPKETP